MPVLYIKETLKYNGTFCVDILCLYSCLVINIGMPVARMQTRIVRMNSQATGIYRDGRGLERVTAQHVSVWLAPFSTA